MQLSPEDIAVAEACGVTFLPATPAQVQRLAMQRRIFYANGQPILATRGDGFFETAGTLQRLIEDGLQQQRDFTAWQQTTLPEVEDAGPEAGNAPSLLLIEGEAAPAMEDAPELIERTVPPKRERRSRRAPEAVNSPSVPLTLEMPLAGSPPAAATGKSAGAVGARPSQPGQRWRVAGAVRRGRAEKHWSTRQR